MPKYIASVKGKQIKVTAATSAKARAQIAAQYGLDPAKVKVRRACPTMRPYPTVTGYKGGGLHAQIVEVKANSRASVRRNCGCVANGSKAAARRRRAEDAADLRDYQASWTADEEAAYRRAVAADKRARARGDFAWPFTGGSLTRELRRNGAASYVRMNPAEGQHQWSKPTGFATCKVCGIQRKLEGSRGRYTTMYGVVGAGPKGGTAWSKRAPVCAR